MKNQKKESVQEEKTYEPCELYQEGKCVHMCPHFSYCDTVTGNYLKNMPNKKTKD